DEDQRGLRLLRFIGGADRGPNGHHQLRLDLVNIQWINFVAASKNVAQEWSSQLFRYATNSFVNNPSFYDMLERSWTKLSVSRDADNLIALKTIYKLFAHHKDDKKRVEKALETCCLLTAKKDSVDAKEFTFDAFLRFYTCLCPRTDIDQICIDFGTPGSNEIIYPYANEAKARELIAKFEPDNAFVEKGVTSSRARAVLSSIVRSCSPGCRCVELDCWDGNRAEEEPIITHGYTMCSEVPFRETMEAIAESAFKVSDYPSSCHLRTTARKPKQQAKMVKLIKDILAIDFCRSRSIRIRYACLHKGRAAPW
uniref:PLCXc domain-containing protein n=1 Tax=Macrostomum lignano TaxID=282301 RepID=A0A1I8FMB5_9PLAT